MNTFIFALLLIGVSTYCTDAASIKLVSSSDSSGLVRLAVYYEVLCPDSRRFIRDQFDPTWHALKDIMDVDISAYGKATDTPNNSGGYDFQCQHGAPECEGNKMLACAKKYITDKDTYITFNICVMESYDPSVAGLQCAEQVGVGFLEVALCTATSEGERLLHDIGVKQGNLRPAVDYIPWMVVNDVHTDFIQDQVETNLHNFVCQKYQGPKPAACN